MRSITAVVSAADSHSSLGTAGLLATVISGAFLAAMLTAAINVWATRRGTREVERARQRDSFADAFRTYTKYKEFPYAIRRRNGSDLANERTRLSEDLRAVQAELSYHRTWACTESASVGDAYATMIAAARAVAGTAMKQAWLAPPCDADSEMTIPREVIDLSSLELHETAYLAAVTQHLTKLTPWWAR
jgi:hypothetical protein